MDGEGGGEEKEEGEEEGEERVGEGRGGERRRRRRNMRIKTCGIGFRPKEPVCDDGFITLSLHTGPITS